MQPAPLIAAVATFGSGKTTYCDVIHGGLENGEHWGPEIERTIKEHCPAATRPDRVIFVKASFLPYHMTRFLDE